MTVESPIHSPNSLTPPLTRPFTETSGIPCVARVLQGWVWECAMIVRVCARGRPTSLQTVQTTPFSRLTKNKNHSNPMLGDREIKIPW